MKQSILAQLTLSLLAGSVAILYMSQVAAGIAVLFILLLISNTPGIWRMSTWIIESPFALIKYDTVLNITIAALITLVGFQVCAATQNMLPVWVWVFYPSGIWVSSVVGFAGLILMSSKKFVASGLTSFAATIDIRRLQIFSVTVFILAMTVGCLLNIFPLLFTGAFALVTSFVLKAREPEGVVCGGFFSDATKAPPHSCTTKEAE